MRLQHAPADLAFQEEVRDFVAAELPAEVRDKVRRGRHLDRADYAEWYGRLHRRGWATPDWAPSWGGTGWTPLRRHLFDEALLLGGAPRMVSAGIMMLGPLLIAYGSPEQQSRHLPAIARTEVWWTQGFSEPGAGSDLAGLRTRAERGSDAYGEHYLVTGQKVWSSYAQFSDWMFCLARTDPAAAKPQEGIGFLLIDMRSPGITVRPIRTLDGGADLNEVFLDRVRVPLENRVGPEHQGWTCAKYLLGHERGGIAGVGAAKQQMARLRRLVVELVDRQPWLAEPAFQAQLCRLEIDVVALEATALRMLGGPGQGLAPAARTSMLKVRGTELRQSIYRLMLQVAGAQAMFWPRQTEPDPEERLFDELRALAPNYLDARKFSIYGGTNEIQRNLIARALLAS